MTKNEKKLLYILFIVILLSFFSFSVSYYSQKKSRASEDIKRYSQLINKIDSNKAETNGINIADNEDTSINKIVELILSHQKATGLVPVKYQIINDKKNPSIDFLLKCDEFQFIEYIKKFNNSLVPYKIKHINIKNDSSGLTINVKFIVGKNYIRTEMTPESKQNLINFMRPCIKNNKQVSKNFSIDNQKNNDNMITSTNHKIIGTLQQNNVNYIYIKNFITDKIIKIQESDIIEDNDAFLIIVYDKHKIKILKDINEEP